MNPAGRNGARKAAERGRRKATSSRGGAEKTGG